MLTEKLGYIYSKALDAISCDIEDTIQKSDNDGYELWVTASKANINILLNKGYINEEEHICIVQSKIDTILFHN